MDLQPGVQSKEGGELTAWGHLHELSPCDLVYTADASGEVVASQVTSVIIAPQFDPNLEAKAAANPDNAELATRLDAQREIEERIFRAQGDKRISLMTCSGPSVADVGAEFQFRYANNLIIETTPIEQNYIEQNRT